ncbi:MAG: cytochrome P450 [Acidimicrobiales bacterium]|nr:cytochrome P450 [Acidimicrobiales bacterium]
METQRSPYAPDFIDVNLWDPATFKSGPPYGEFAKLREAAPVAWHPEPPRREGGKHGPGFWCVTSHEGIRTISLDPTTYSSWLGGFTGADISGAILEETRMNLMAMDPPDHTLFRNSIREPFGSKGVAGLTEAIARYCDDVVAGLEGLDRFDFVEMVASELPLLTLSHILGVKAEDRRQFYDWSNKIIGNHDPDFGGTVQDFLRAKDELFAYGRAVIADRRAAPGDDLVSAFIKSEIEGEPLTNERIIMLWYLLLVAGNETTRSSLTGCMQMLSEFPDQRELLMSDLDRYLPGFVEEALRYTNPVLHFRRTATVDHHLLGADIKAGDKLLMWYPAANRDPAMFDRPDEFDITREPNHHLAFGIGTHFCLGARLGRLQIKMMLRALLEAYPSIDVTAPATRAHSNFLNCAKTLPVRV